MGAVISAGTASLPFVNYEFPQEMAAWNGLVLVGEAPGKEEARLGRPFVGRSGKLLDELLTEAGISRARTVVANVFRYQPPGNKVDHFFISRRAAEAQGIGLAEKYGRFGSAWCRADYAKELENLGATLEKLRRQKRGSVVAMALGRTAFWALTGENGLLAKLGKRLDCRLSPGLPVVPTYHPSFILRGNWGKRPEWLEHFNEAARG